jgi:transposase-like protein
MGKTRRAYTPEFRRRIVELVRAGRSPEELAEEFEPTAQSIRCESAWRLTPDRLRRLTPPAVLHTVVLTRDYAPEWGSRLDAERGQAAAPKHRLFLKLRPAWSRKCQTA